MNRAILFDLDGVLLKSGNCEIEAWRRMFSDFGAPYSADTYWEFSGMPGKEVVLEYLKPEASQEEARQLEQRKAEYFLECMRGQGVELMEGARALVEQAHEAGYALAVVTGGQSGRTAEALRLVGLDSYFPVIVGTDNGERGKPHPDPFLKAARELRVPKERCAVIEDAPVGIAAAKEAGMKCVAVATNYAKEKLQAADIIADSLLDVSVDTIARLLDAPA